MSDPTMTDVKVPGTEWMSNYDTGRSDFIAPPQAKEVLPNGKVVFTKFLVQAPGDAGVKVRGPEGNWLKTADGYLKIVVDGAKLVDSGYVLKETHIGTAQYKKYGKDRQPTGELRNASPALDYFHAFGIDLQPGSAEDYETYARATVDRQAQVTIDWSAWDNDAKQTVADRWEDFPLVDANSTEQVDAFKRLYPGQDPTGKRLPFLERNGKRFWARAEVKRWISAVEEKKA